MKPVGHYVWRTYLGKTRRNKPTRRKALRVQIRKCVQRLNIRDEASETVVQFIVDVEKLAKVSRNSHCLHAKAFVGRNSNAILSNHGDARAAVIRHNRLEDILDTRASGTVRR